MWNLVIGILLILAGLSRQFVFPFTRSPELVVVVGVIIALWGGWQTWQQYGRR